MQCPESYNGLCKHRNQHIYNAAALRSVGLQYQCGETPPVCIPACVWTPEIFLLIIQRGEILWTISVVTSVWGDSTLVTSVWGDSMEYFTGDFSVGR